MKKIISVLLIFAMLFTLCACNSTKKGSSDSKTAGKNTVVGSEEAFFVDDIQWGASQKEIKKSSTGTMQMETDGYLYYYYKQLETANVTDIGVAYNFQDDKLTEVFVDADYTEETFRSLADYFIAEEVSVDMFYTESDNCRIYLQKDETASSISITLQPIEE